MLETLKKALCTKVATVIVMGLIGVSGASLTVVLALGKSSLEDHSQAMAQYSQGNKELAESVRKLNDLVMPIHKGMYDDKIKELVKQHYKMKNAAKDVRPMDVESAADFCASSLFDQYNNTLSGSEKINVSISCIAVNNWSESALHK